MADSDLELRPIVPGDWPAIERLFGHNGACGGCWCMFWRVPSQGKHWAAVKGDPNKAAFRQLVQSGRARGCIALAASEPVGWVSVAPRADFAYLSRSRTIPAPPAGDTWCVSCFFIARRWRKRGVATALLRAAAGYAESSGAAVLEGYPTAPTGARKPVPAAFAHTGVPRLFEAAGFRHVCDIGARQVWARDFRRR